MEDLLKEFWPVALFFVISIVSYVRNNNAKMKQSENEMQPHNLDENFPEIEVAEVSSTYSHSASKPRRPIENKRVNKENTLLKSGVQPVAAPPVPSAGDRGAKVAFKGKSDVKKAFIYSEILNRKY